jgi:hypothetical protein
MQARIIPTLKTNIHSNVLDRICRNLYGCQDCHNLNKLFLSPLDAPLLRKPQAVPIPSRVTKSPHINDWHKTC